MAGQNSVATSHLILQILSLHQTIRSFQAHCGTIYKIHAFMKKNYILLALSMSLAFFSCSSDEENAAGGGQVQQTTTETEAVISGYIYGEGMDDSGLSTRSTYTPTKAGLDFKWEYGDKIAAYSEKDAFITFESHTKDSGINAAFHCLDTEDHTYTFEPNSWYWAIFPYDAEERDRNNIHFDFSGQRQVANGDYAHLAKYDFNVARTYCTRQEKVHFDFKHAASVVRFKLTLPAGMPQTSFKRLELKAADNSFIQTTRICDLVNAGEDEGEEYKPNFISIYDDDIDEKEDDIFYVDLGKDEKSGISVKGGETLTVYITIPSDNLYGKNISATLVPMDESTKYYYVTVDGKDFQPGYAYGYTKTMIETTKVKVNLQVNTKWQLGNVAETTRSASGDPGKEDVFDKPKNVVVYTFVNNKLVYTNVINGIPESDWTVSGDLLVYTKDINPDVNILDAKSIHVYAYASNQAITMTPSTIADGTDESVLRNATFTTTNQSLLKNLYSIPYSASDFKGNVPLSNPSIVATLYHVAAKVDLQWGVDATTTKFNGYTVNKLLDKGYLFRPAENATAGSKTYTYTATPATQYYGRDYFYAIQQKDFPLSIKLTKNGKAESSYKTIDFSTETTGNLTYWLKGNITLE